MSRLFDIDWHAPWLAPYAAVGRPLSAAVAAGGSVASALTGAAQGARLFVPQSTLPAGTAYEAFIGATGQVPTRDNLHDLLNGLVWLHLPRAKARLTDLQAAEIARHGTGPRRGPLRDALTLFDENGALLLAPQRMWDALRARDWRGLFVTHRAAWREARLLVVGHGLLEQLCRPRKPLTAHVHPAPQALDSIADIDAWLASALDAPRWRDKPFAPLPVLGVPGWCAGNEQPSFYDDALVFRRAGRSDLPPQRALPGAA